MIHPDGRLRKGFLRARVRRYFEEAWSQGAPISMR